MAFNKKKKARANTDVGLLTESSPWPVKEAYKALRTNLMFSLPDDSSKIIAVTSAFRHDGKSINSVNLAISLGQLDKKVLLIDCDMRLPTIASKIGIKAKPGMSDFIVGQADVRDIFHRSDELGIDIIPAGNIPPDPTWLLQSEKMDKLLDAFRKTYDYIIIDLPPVTTVSDAAILSKKVDGYVLVVRNEVTEFRAIADMLNQLKMADAKIIGFIYNDANSQGGKYYKKGYYRKGGYYSKD